MLINAIYPSKHLNQTKDDRNVRLIIIPVKAKKCIEKPEKSKISIFAVGFVDLRVFGPSFTSLYQ